MSAPGFVPLTTYREFPAQEMVSRAKSFRDEMLRRRTVRQFSSRPSSSLRLSQLLSETT
jgi:hypothetical protein